MREYGDEGEEEEEERQATTIFVLQMWRREREGELVMRLGGSRISACVRGEACSEESGGRGVSR